MYTKASLLTPARSLLTALTTSAPIPTLLTHFTRDPYPTAHEHGLPALAPFLGRTFTGTDGVARYFEILGETLGIERMEFEGEEQWVVDTEAMVVVVRGDARFVSRRTGEGWDEWFVYRLGMAEDVGGDEDGGGGRMKGLKVQEYLVWADTGAAYLAMNGKLGDVTASASASGTGTGKGTRKSMDRRRSGCGEVVGSGMNAYGSCGQ